MQQEQKNSFHIVHEEAITVDVAEDQLINSLLAVAIGHEPLADDFQRIELSYSSKKPKLRLISVDGKCLGALIYEQEMFIGDNGMGVRTIVRFDKEIKK